MTQPLDFQSIIFNLQAYWHTHGCLIWQPYHTEVGAGTMNPATFLRSLGPEPWNVAYVEPSIRPDDGRYGENPNRFYQHTQYQVIIKPDRGNSQELYLGSLEALGIDLKKHDIRFVEDNWAQPAISAWGLGWEVWLDGLEITQFTYFQQVGGITLNPVAVELTYGLERIAMALQNVRDFKNIRWNQDVTYGDVLLQNEQEASRYAFEIADVERLNEMFDLYEAEAKTCLSTEQVIPAYDYVLKCSHTFNVLDTRGAIGVTERAGFFRRMRALARGVAQAYTAQREAMDYPWLKKEKSVTQKDKKETNTTVFSRQPSPFILEIGVEELPPDDLEAALKQLRTRVPALLEELRLEHGEVRIFGTPRRLGVVVDDLAPAQPDWEQVFRGPPANRAYDADSNPTRAAQGFARGKGVAVDALEVRETDGGRYVVAVVAEKGQPSAAVLAEALPKLLGSLHFTKTMRWNASGVAFSRPIRWLLALYGETAIPFAYAGLQTGNATRGLRFVEPQEITISAPAEYFAALETQGIILDPEARKAEVKVQIQAIAQEAGGEVVDDPALLTEVAHLVEAPTALRGDFAPEHLTLPKEVLISVMKKHQRYFPIQKNGALLPHFVIVANKPEGMPLEAIKLGNEDVIRARFADAAYFVRDDMGYKLETFVPKLERLTFHAKLGSMLDKTRRIEGLTQALAPKFTLTPAEETAARRTAALCKADLATKMVVEMTSLQGTMGRHYALAAKEDPAVADALFEHYLPRFAGDAAPKGKPGLVVGVADRLDSLVGLFAAGLAPTGNKDPFALRRAALGLVQTLIAWNLDFDLGSAIRAAARRQPIPISPETKGEVLTFIGERLRNQLLDEGHVYDVVDAALGAQAHNPASAARAVKQLSVWVGRDDWGEILPTYSRCVRITRQEVEQFAVDPAAFVEAAERHLWAALQAAETTPRAPGSVDDFLHAFLPMMPAVNQFFDDVLVMAEDKKLRRNRLGMLQRISALANGSADMRRLEGF